MFGKTSLNLLWILFLKRFPCAKSSRTGLQKVTQLCLVAAEMKENALKTTETDLYGLQTRISSSVPNQHIWRSSKKDITLFFATLHDLYLELNNIVLVINSVPLTSSCSFLRPGTILMKMNCKSLFTNNKMSFNQKIKWKSLMKDFEFESIKFKFFLFWICNLYNLS